MWPSSPTGRFASATAASSPSLFPPQRLDRREPDRAPGGVERPDHGDPEREREPPGEDAGGEVRRCKLGQVAAADEQLGGSVAGGEADREREQPDADRLAQDQ